MRFKLWAMKGITNLLTPPKSKVWKNGEDRLIGMQYCLFLDYDKATKQQMDDEILYLRKKFVRIPTMWLISTRKDHYWLMSFGIFTRRDILDILFHAHCDPLYFLAFKTYGRNTLRITRKESDPSVLRLERIDYKRTLLPISKQHTELFEDMFGAKDIANSESNRTDCGLETVIYYQRHKK